MRPYIIQLVSTTLCPVHWPRAPFIYHTLLKDSVAFMKMTLSSHVLSRAKVNVATILKKVIPACCRNTACFIACNLRGYLLCFLKSDNRKRCYHVLNLIVLYKCCYDTLNIYIRLENSSKRKNTFLLSIKNDSQTVSIFLLWQEAVKCRL